MTLLDQLAEQSIREAMERGELDDLPGSGRRLNLDDDSFVPEHLRAGFRVLRNAGFIPPELQWRREMANVEDLLRNVSPDAVGEKRRAQRRLQMLMMRLEGRGHGGPLWVQEAEYAQRVLDRLDRELGE
ncbi:MAG: DnaJ family domain-containing protein [Aquisalimonadaceae bacterium]